MYGDRAVSLVTATRGCRSYTGGTGPGCSGIGRRRHCLLLPSFKHFAEAWKGTKIPLYWHITFGIKGRRTFCRRCCCVLYNTQRTRSRMCGDREVSLGPLVRPGRSYTGGTGPGCSAIGRRRHCLLLPSFKYFVKAWKRKENCFLGVSFSAYTIKLEHLTSVYFCYFHWWSKSVKIKAL